MEARKFLDRRRLATDLPISMFNWIHVKATSPETRPAFAVESSILDVRKCQRYVSMRHEEA